MSKKAFLEKQSAIQKAWRLVNIPQMDIFTGCGFPIFN